ncbi:MAG: hypothetical protein ACUVTD_08825 [Nitrososphaerales archaeon]
MVSEGYVDVNVFIYWLGNHPVFGKKAYELMKKIEGSRKGKYVTFCLTLYQTFLIIAGLTGGSLRDKNLRNVLESVIGLKGIEITPLTPEDETAATGL